MKKLLLLFILLSIFSSCNNNITPEGRVTEEDRVIGEFMTLDVSSGIEVEFIQCDTTLQAVVETYESVHDHLKVLIMGTVLEIYLDEDSSFDNIPVLNVKVYAKNLPIAIARETSHIKLSTNLTSKFSEIWLYNGSTFSMEEDSLLTVNGSLRIELEQGSKCTIKGSAKSLNAGLDGGSFLSASNFSAEEVKATIRMRSTMEVSVSETFQFNADGRSTIRHSGKGTGQTIANGGSIIEHQ